MTVEAIYTQGVLRPVEPLDGLHENERVTVTVIPRAAPAAEGGRFARFVGTLTDEEAEEMRKAIEDAFERVEGAW